MKKLLLLAVLAIFAACEKEEIGLNDTVITYGDGVTDIDGNKYKTVIIGSQEWMAENLETTRLNTGEPANYITNDLGYLYNYNIDICPAGWNLPSQNQWKKLFEYVGGLENAGKLKSINSEHWEEPNTDAANLYGFNAIGGGVLHDYDEDIVNYKKRGRYWTTEYLFEDDVFVLVVYTFYHDSGSATMGSNYIKDYISVRCIKN